MPITAHCPKCKRLAYMSGGVCEFCGYELPPEAVGRVVGREIVRETRPRVEVYSLSEMGRSEYDVEGVDRWLFEAQDILGTLFADFRIRKSFQREAAELATVIESLEALRTNWKRRGPTR